MSAQPPKNRATSKRRASSASPGAQSAAIPDHVNSLPFEVEEQIQALRTFLDQEYDPISTPGGRKKKLGSVKWGVYAFIDYDEEPIYVGQTKESLSTRLGRHLTGRRSDAVAKNILDPFEVAKVLIYPLPELQDTSAKDADAKRKLNSLEHKVYNVLRERSSFKAVLNEQVPAYGGVDVLVPEPLECEIATAKIRQLRAHPDIRIARRAQTLAALATGISERKVGKGIRYTLLTQARRLAELAGRRAEAADGQNVPPEERDEQEARQGKDTSGRGGSK
jgi:hypothetical protein